MRLAALPVCLLATALSLPSHAAEWLTVAADKVRRVELDVSSLTESDGGTKSAWGRVVLNDSQAAIVGYKDVRALNRYDCKTRSFVIVKRVYLSPEGRTLREEAADSSRPISVKSGTVDERFFNEICKPPTANDLRNIARLAEKNLGKASARQANINLASEEEAPASKSSKNTRPPQPASAQSETPRGTREALKDQRPAKPEPKPVVSAPSASSEEKPKPAAKTSVQTPPSIPASQAATLTKHQPGLSASPATAKALEQTPAAPQVMRPAASKHSLRWSYEGEGGPQNWAKLSPDYAACGNGQRQSPIDIRDGIRVDQEVLKFDYTPSFFRIVDNGHTIEVNYGAGSTLSVMGRIYELKQMHFHLPSEERIDGKSFPMVAHLLHRDPEGRLAVVAVLIERGAPNALVQTLWNNLPLEKNEDYRPATAVNLLDLLPQKHEYYSYMGSLTTPPCTEGVLWLVLRQPITLSPEQIGIFARFYSNNARPVQATNGRTIKESR